LSLTFFAIFLFYDHTILFFLHLILSQYTDFKMALGCCIMIRNVILKICFK